MLPIFFLFSHDMCLTYRYTSAWGLFQMQIITNHSSWCSILFDRNDHRILSFDSLMLQYSTLSICNVVSHFVSIQSFILVLSTHSCIDFGGTKWITTNYYPPIIIIGSTHLVFLDVKQIFVWKLTNVKEFDFMSFLLRTWSQAKANELALY